MVPWNHITRNSQWVSCVDVPEVQGVDGRRQVCARIGTTWRRAERPEEDHSKSLAIIEKYPRYVAQV